MPPGSHGPNEVANAGRSDWPAVKVCVMMRGVTDGNQQRAVLVKNLAKRYGDVQAVRDVSFEVESGEIFGILGANGSGKTTTIEMLQGLRKRDSGDIQVLGLDPQTQRDLLRHRIGSQLQESALPERLRVWEALDLFGALSPRSRDWQSLVQEWGLAGKEKAAFANLSGGQRQRLFVALALVNQPEIVFLDEMTTGLDPAGRHAAWELVRDVRRQGATVVLVTHFMDEAEDLCDRIAVFRRGEVQAIDTPAGLVQSFADRSTVRFTHDGEELEALRAVPGLQELRREGRQYTAIGEGPLLAHVASVLAANGIYPADLRVERATLEQAYLRMTSAEEVAP